MKSRILYYTVEKPDNTWLGDQNNITNKGQTDIGCHQLGFFEEDKSLMLYELGTHDLNLITKEGTPDKPKVTAAQNPELDSVWRAKCYKRHY